VTVTGKSVTDEVGTAMSDAVGAAVFGCAGATVLSTIVLSCITPSTSSGGTVIQGFGGSLRTTNGLKRHGD
jgi:hypothetical protein